MGYFRNVPFCLRWRIDDECLVVDQADPAGSNPFMVAEDANPDAQQPPTITQYRTWPADSDGFLPAFLACYPPEWIWDFAPLPDDGWDQPRKGVQWLFDNAATVTHAELSEEQLEVKQIFDEAAGPLYRRFAYEPVYVLLRTLCEFAIFWVSDDEGLEDVDVLIDLWERVKTQQ